MRSTILYSHIPKTAGSALYFAYRLKNGANHHLHVGPFSRIDRFVNRQPQIEELEDFDSLQLFLGHYVTSDHVALFRDRSPRLATTVRSPFALVKSHVNYREFMKAPHQAPTDPREYCGPKHANFMARFLIEHFSSLSPYGEELSERNIRMILSCFHYIAICGRPETLQPLLHSLDIEGPHPRRNSRPHSLEMNFTEAEFRAVNPLDYFLFEAVDRQMPVDGHAGEAIFGSAGRNQMRQFLAENSSRDNRRSMISSCYHTLVSDIHSLGYGAVFRSILEETDITWIRHPDLFRKAIAQLPNSKFFGEKMAEMTSEQRRKFKAREMTRLAKYRMDIGDIVRAKATLEQAFALNMDDPMAISLRK